MVTNDRFIEKISDVYRDIVKEKKGKIYLFMLIKMDEYVDRWSLLISASWFKDENFRDEFKYMLDKLANNLDPGERESISRLGLFTKDEHLVELFTNSYQVIAVDSPIRIKDTQVNGYKVHEAYIFYAQKAQD